MTLNDETIQALYKYAYTACYKWKVRDHAPDATQDAIVAALESLKTYDPKRSADPQKRARIIGCYAARGSAKREARRREKFRTNDTRTS